MCSIVLELLLVGFDGPTTATMFYGADKISARCPLADDLSPAAKDGGTTFKVFDVSESFFQI
jgi:hypothetical protein